MKVQAGIYGSFKKNKVDSDKGQGFWYVHLKKIRLIRTRVKDFDTKVFSCWWKSISSQIIFQLLFMDDHYALCYKLHKLITHS